MRLHMFEEVTGYARNRIFTLTEYMNLFKDSKQPRRFVRLI